MRTLILFILLLFPATALGGVIFETNFDSNADWNTSRQYHDENSGGNCYGTCAAAPVNWSNFRTIDGPGSSWNKPTGSIQRPPGPLADHTGTGSGKSYVVYNQSVSVGYDAWVGDSELLKKLGAQYNELYLRAWIRTQPGWQSVASAMGKIIRLQYFNGVTNNEFANFYDGSNAPIALLFLGQASGSSSYPAAGAYSMGYRCYPQTADSNNEYYCSLGPSFEQTDTAQYINASTHASPTATWADGGWHRYDMHVKMNTPGSNNGTMEFSIDGVSLISQVGTVHWIAPGATAVGWNVLSLGGNSNNHYTNNGQEWYAIDDVVVSTTSIPANYVPGGSSSGATSAVGSFAGTIQ